MNKTITPVISVILLIMLTIAVSASAWYWVNSMQANLQTNSAQNIESTTQASNLKYTLISVTCNLTGNITIQLRNDGETDISSTEIFLIKLMTVEGAELGSYITTLPTPMTKSGAASYGVITFPLSAPTPTWANLMQPVLRYQVRTDVEGAVQSGFCTAR